MEAAIVFLMLWSWDNIDFLNTRDAQVAQGYVWEKIECRKPNEDLPHFTWKGEVCHKLVK